MAKLSAERRKQLQQQQSDLLAGDRDNLRYNVSDLRRDTIRLLPVPTKLKIFKRVGTHFVDNKAYTCPRVTWNEKCPLCKIHDKLANSTKKRDRELADNLVPRSRWLFRVVSRSDRPLQVRVLEAPKSIFKAIWDAYFGDSVDGSEGEDIADPKTGRDIKISATGSGFRRKYKAKVELSTSALAKTEKRVKKLKAEARKIDLEEFPFRSDDLKEVAEGLLENEDEVDEDDDLDFDEDEDDDDVMEELAKKKRRAAGRKGKKVDKKKAKKKSKKKRKK